MKKKDIPVVILHGWGLSEEKFKPLVKELTSRSYTVYALDFPGFGKTALPAKPMTLSDYADFLYTWLDKHNINKPVLIGHSFGGRVSLRFNTLYPKSVRTLILTGTPGYRPVKPGKFLFFVIIGKIGKFLLSLPLLSMFHEAIKNKYYYIIGAREYTKAKGVMKETFKHIVTDQLIDDMKKIDIPTHLIWGGDDKIVPISIAEKMNRTIQGSTLSIIPGADHGVPYKQPVVFADFAEKYLS